MDLEAKTQFLLRYNRFFIAEPVVVMMTIGIGNGINGRTAVKSCERVDGLSQLG